MRFCSKCGTQIEDGQKFCRSWGQPTSTDNTQQLNIPTNANANGSNYSQNASNFKTAQNNYQTQNSYVQPPKDGKKISKKALIGIVSAAIFLVVCISAYFVGASVNSKKSCG